MITLPGTSQQGAAQHRNRRHYPIQVGCRVKVKRGDEFFVVLSLLSVSLPGISVLSVKTVNGKMVEGDNLFQGTASTLNQVKIKAFTGEHVH